MSGDEANRPALVWPTVTVRESYLAGELATAEAAGAPTDWVGPARADFEEYVAARRGVHQRWGVPTTIFWYVDGPEYYGTLVLRHELTPQLAEAGGHIGYHVVLPWRRRGHATRMLAAGLVEARALGLDRVLLTCATDNEASRRTILANGGVPDGQAHGEDRFWIALGDTSARPE